MNQEVLDRDAVSYEALGRFSRLFVTYVSRFERLASYYAYPFSDRSAWHRARDAVTALPRDRATLVEVLSEQNEAWGMDDATRDNISRLASADAVAVVTGQQVGLLGGPMYTLYKTITAVRLAREMESELGVPVVPVFWLEGEDHDFDEVSHIAIPKGDRVVELRLENAVAEGAVNAGPVGRMTVDHRMEPVFEGLERLLPPTEYSEEVMAITRRAYAPGRTLRDAFACLMKQLLPGSGLVFLSAEDRRLKQRAAPLYRKELEEFDETSARVIAASRQLEADFHAQVHSRPTNIFMLEDEGRLSLEPENGHFHLRGTGRTFEPDEIIDLLDARPERFSPNVILRPLSQDLLLPTIAYVGGPSEVAYFAQYRDVYAWAGIPMPIIFPRAGATLIESHVRRTMDRYDISIADLAGNVEQLFKRIVLERMDVDLERTFDETSEMVDEGVDRLIPLAESIDATLVKSAEAARTNMRSELDRLKQKLLRAEKRNHDQARSQIDRAHASTFPNGNLQERTLSLVYFLNKYGPELPRMLMDRLSLDVSSHQLIEL